MLCEKPNLYIQFQFRWLIFIDKLNGTLNSISKKQVIYTVISFACFLLVYRLGVPALGQEMGSALAVIIAGVLLWVLEPFPLSLTCFLIIFGFMVTGTATTEVVLSGFSSSATFLILAGLMMAQGISHTTLGERAAYRTILWFGASPKGSLLALLLTLQLLAFFVPATAVKATLLLPITYTLSKNLVQTGSHPRVHKMLLLGLAYGTHITGLAVLPGALGNVITADLISANLPYEMTYTRWLAYFAPVSLVLIPCAWFILTRAFPAGKEGRSGERIDYLEQQLEAFGPLTAGEKRLIAILLITVVLWMTDFIHGWPAFVPAFLAVIFMALPGVGFISWDRLLKISWGNVLMVGTNLSMGMVFISTGAAGYLATTLFPESILPAVFAFSILGFILMGSLVHFYHLFIGNVATLIIIMVPMVLELGAKTGIDPLYWVLITGASSLLGFILVIQTMPGVIVYSTGELTALDFIKAGVPLTLASIVVLALAARFWWPLLETVYVM